MGDSDSGPYAVGEKVLVPHTDKYYEAKVQKAEYREAEGQWFYLLHYSGWNKKWDEWVEESGLQKAPACPTPAAKNNKKAGKGGKGGKQNDTADAGPVQFEVQIPAHLKVHMLDDYDAIKKENKLVPLPRKPNIHEILSHYVRDAFERNANADVEDDLACGLKLYFDKALFFSLLYPQEREQAETELASGKMPSAVYGVEHLMRLFYKLPELLPTADMPSDQIASLQARLADVMQFIVANEKRFFLTKADYKQARLPSQQRKLAAPGKAAGPAALGAAAATAGAAWGAAAPAHPAPAESLDVVMADAQA